MMNAKLLFATAMTAIGLASCGHGGHPEPQHGDEEQDGKGLSGEIVISSKQAAAMGIASETAGMGAFCPTLAVSGKVMEAGGDERTVAAPTAGIVRLSRQLPEGSRLGKGMTAMTIDASQIEGGSPAEAAEVTYRTALANYERAKRLLADKLVSEKDYNAAKAAYESARLAREATPASRNGIVSVASPMAGYVKTCYVSDGDYVTVGQPLLSVTQNRRIYLRVDLPERHYEQLDRIHSATFRTAAANKVYDLDELGGKLIATGKSSEATPGYIPVTFEFNNTKGILLAHDVAACFRDPHNPMYDPQRAIEEGHTLFCQPGRCPFDLLKAGMALGLLPDARFPFHNGRALLHDNWDFVARYYLGEYYEGR